MQYTNTTRRLHDLFNSHIQQLVLTKYYQKIVSNVLRHKILNYFLFMLPVIRNNIEFFFKVPSLSPLVLIIGAVFQLR